MAENFISRDELSSEDRHYYQRSADRLGASQNFQADVACLERLGGAKNAGLESIDSDKY